MQTRAEAGCRKAGGAAPAEADPAEKVRRFGALIEEMQDLIPDLAEAVRGLQRTPEQRSVLAAARQLQEERQRRAALFGETLFVEPGWDLLLDLFVARLEGRSVSVSSACIASFAPTSTALRHITHLEQLGYVAKRPHPSDSRSKYIEITELGASRMSEFFSGSLARRHAPGR